MTAAALSLDFIKYIKEVRGFSHETVRSYFYVLNCFIDVLGERDIQTLTIQTLDNYIADFARIRGLKPSSINTVRCVLRSFFLYVDRYRGIRLTFDASYIRQIKAPRGKIRFVTPEKAVQIISMLKTGQDRLMLLTMFSTGMRIGELVNFSVEDFHEIEITVRGKGGKNRVIPIEEHLAKELKAHMYEHDIRTGPIFRHENKAYTVSGFRKRLYRRLGPLHEYEKPHSFRHGIATSLLMNGMDIRSLQTFLGHSHIATTMLYTHVTDSHLRESYLKYTPTSGMDFAIMLDK